MAEEKKPLEEMTGDELFEEYMAIKDDAFQLRRIKKIKNLGKSKFKRNFFEEGDVNFKPKPDLSPSEFGMDVLKSGTSGIARGVTGAVDTPAHL